jgi:hypothetical protein
MQTTSVQRIVQRSYYLHQGQAVVSFKSSTLSPDVDKGKLEKVSVPGSNEDPVSIMTWGKNNDLPQVMEDLVGANNIVPALMGTKQRILVGNGLMPHVVRYEKKAGGKMERIVEEVEMPEQVKNWLDGEGWGDGLDFWMYLDGAAEEYVKHSLIIPEFVRFARDGQKIKSIEIKECKTMRAAKKDDGRIRAWYWSGHWGKKTKTSAEEETRKITKIEVYTGEERKQGKFIMPVGDYLFNDGYYPIPTWRGSKDWIEMANFIAPFHKANLENGYNIRWHIEIPENYFLDYEKYNGATTEEERAALLAEATTKEQAFMDDVNRFLAGIANAGRTVWTKFEWDRASGKKYPGIEIKALEYDMKDESLLKLHDSSLKAAISSQGIHPTLANIETAGKLSSGTEIRNAFLMWLIINTPGARKKMLKPLELVKKVNGWDKNINYAIRDYELTALSSNSAGMQERENPVTQ